MSKWRVGQSLRIRWVYQAKNCQDIGKTGVVDRPVYSEKFGHGVELSGFTGWYMDDQLEPATDSYDVTTWDSCVWRPEHLRVGV